MFLFQNEPNTAGEAGDGEMSERIRRHRERRGPDGTTIESEPTTLAFEVGHHEDDGHGIGGGDDEGVHFDIVQDDHGHIEMRFATHDGVVYQMEISSDLETWQDEGEAFTGNGEEKTLEMPEGSDRLYTRLKIVNQG